MEIEGVRVALGLVCAKQPSFALGILAKKEGGGPQQPRPASSTASRLCICTYCRKKSNERRKLCFGKTKPNCHSRLPSSINFIPILQSSYKYCK